MPEKIQQAERDRLDQLKSQVNSKVLAYGRQKYVVKQLEDELERERQEAREIEEEIDELKTEYDNFVQKLYQRYGDVAIDLDTGDIVDQQ